MSRLVIPIEGVDRDHLAQLEYALAFVSEGVDSYALDRDSGTVTMELRPDASREAVAASVNELVQRYARREFGLPSVVHFKQERDLKSIDAWSELLARRWVTQVGEGHVILRGPAAQLMSLVNARVESMFARAFGAELEVYPATIKCETLDRCNHYTSFPEHIDFVAHLRHDLGVLKEFSDGCREHGWKPGLHEGRMAQPDFAVSPSCCYHCYEGMQGWELDKPGRCTTMTLACHRYEGANHRSMSRLRAFTMREVVWVGHPRYVIESRAKAEELIIQWAKDWELDCTLETANDMFFTDDYAVKASFQRQQQAKRELRLRIPSEDQAISVFSSNFHATTFGKAFDIKVDGRPATSACTGWGFERWVYALFSQFGFDFDEWPAGLREELRSHTARPVA